MNIYSEDNYLIKQENIYSYQNYNKIIFVLFLLLFFIYLIVILRKYN